MELSEMRKRARSGDEEQEKTTDRVVDKKGKMMVTIEGTSTSSTKVE